MRFCSSVCGENGRKMARRFLDIRRSLVIPGTNVAVGPGTGKLLRMSLGAQSGYYVATGVWPLLHRRSFEAITGRKVDFWLVQTVGATVAAIGVGLALSARRDGPSDEMRATALLAAFGLGMID